MFLEKIDELTSIKVILEADIYNAFDKISKVEFDRDDLLNQVKNLQMQVSELN